MATMTQVTPMIWVGDIDAAVSFYGRLGFAPGVVMEGAYAFVRRDAVALRMLRAHDPEALRGNEEAHQLVYIDVDDVDALYHELSETLAALPEGRVRPPHDREYGQREFHVLDGDATTLLFGTAIP